MNNLLRQQISDSINHYKNGDINQSKKIALEIISNNPENVDANYILGIIATFEENFTEAINYFNFVLTKNPSDPELWNYRAIALSKKENFEEAIHNFEKALSLGGKNQEKICNNIVIAIFQKNLNLMNKDYSKAIFYSKKALEINDKNTSTLNNLALALIYHFEYSEAISILKKILKTNPKSVVATQNLGLAYKYQNNYNLAEKYYQKTLFLTENNILKSDNSLRRHDIRTTLGEVQLSQLKFAEGWKNFMAKSLLPNTQYSLQFNIPIWEPKFGFEKNVLIVGQFGLGEQILFSSIIPDLYTKFQSISFIVDNRLMQIMKKSFPDINIIGKNDVINEKDFDFYLPMTALGLYFRKNINDFKPYRKILSSGTIKNNKKRRLKCALSWKSNNPEFGFLKSLDFNSLKYLTQSLTENEIEFYNIQYTNEDNDIIKLKNEFGIEIKNIDGLDTLNDISALSNFISQCDFTINISNTNAHLSAALNIKTYLLLSKGVGTLWYWENEINNSNIWYSSITKFRQIEEGKWIYPIDNLIKSIKTDFI